MTFRWCSEVVHEPPIGATEMTPSPNPRRTSEFERGVLPLRPELQRVARRYTGNVHDAEDRSAVHPSAELEALQGLPDGRLRHAFAALPASLALAVYYADVCQYAYKEIAGIEGIPLGTVMSRIHRARKQLRLALSDLAPAHRPVPGSITTAA
jgi:DNA-directed RNA polymerase specialized sigma24 family protein